MKRTPTLLLALLTPFVMVWSGMAYAAGNCNNGKTLYNKSVSGSLACGNSSCHKSNVSANNILAGAGNASAIDSALNNVSEMSSIDVRGTLGLTASDLDDLAQWIFFAPTCPAAGPIVAASPSSINFGSVTNGNTSAATLVTVSNTGAGAASGLTYSNTASTKWLVTGSTCGSTLAAGASCTFNIAYKPAAAGATDSGSYSSNGTGTFSVSLSGSSPAAATPANLSISPGSAAFGSVLMGSSSATQSFTVSNTGGTGATAVAFSNSNGAEFVVSNNTCGTTLASGASCGFSLKYTPSAAGADSATLSITYTGGTTVNLAMTGTGAAAGTASLQATPAALAFGTITVGSTSGTQSVSISNTGSATATSFALANGDATHFPVSGNTCGTSLAAGASCSLNVAYAPNAVSTNNAALTFSYAGGTNVTVQLAGTGSAAATANLATSPSSGTFGTVTVGQSSSALAVTLTNSGSAVASGVSFSNSNGAEFVVSNNTCGTTLAGGASCGFSLRYTPSAAGADSATLSIAYIGGTTVNFTMTGTGAVPGTASLQATPVSLAFGTITVGSTSGTQSVSISNTGSATATSFALANGDATHFPVSGNTCGSSLAAGASCSLNVAYAPNTASTNNAALTFSYLGGTNVTVQLAGTGSAAATANLTTSPSGGTFGTVIVGQSSGALAVTLTNSGSAAASGVSFSNSNGAEFVVSNNTCGTTLAGGASCGFSLKYTPSAVGADSATLTINATGGAAVVMSLSGTGAVTAPQPGQLSLPAAITMAAQQVSTISAARSVSVSNLGPGAVNVLSVVSNNPAEFAIGSNGCGTLQASNACSFDITFKPSAVGGRSATITITSNGTNSPQTLAVTGAGTAGAPPPPPPSTTVDVIEYYHAEFGHYFITYLADEIVKLDNGIFKGWARTGKQFKAWTTQASVDQVPVCRFFTVAFAPKSSHFYTPFAPECAVVKTNAVWTFEGEVFYTMQASVAGVCPANTVPVYRMYNNGQSGAPNHRYTTEMSVRTKMLAEGWIPEGAGTIGVIMCSPP